MERNAVSNVSERHVFLKDDALALKGLAILMMLLHHCFRAQSLYENHVISFFPFRELTVVHLAMFCKICVSLFAFISGYGLFQNYRKSGISSARWITGRYVSAFSGYWFVWIIAAVVCQIIDNRTGRLLFTDGLWKGIAYTAIDLSGTAKLFGTPTLNGTWWYMSAAVTFIILTPFVFSQRKNLVPVLLCCILLLRVLTGKNGDGVYTGDNSVFAFLTPFLLGCLCDETGLLDRWAAIGRGVWWKKAIKIMLELTLLVFLYKLYFEIPIKRFWEFHFGFVPFVLIVFCTEFILPIPGVKHVLRFFGKYSYGIFLIHTFIRAYYLGNITYSMRHFLLVILFLLGSSLVLSIVIELLKKVTRYSRLVELIKNRIAGEKPHPAAEK